MKIIIITLLFISFAFNLTAEPNPAPSASDWPREYKVDGHTVVVFQPQLENWENYVRIYGKAAVAVTPKGDKDPIFGAMLLEANSETNFDTRKVLFKDIIITELKFSSANDDLANQLKKIVRQALPKGKRMVISLDRVIAALERTALQRKEIAVNLEPPPIFRSEQSAILVIFMGDPKFQPIADTQLMFAVNTEWTILQQIGEGGNYFLLYGESWLKTDDLKAGTWAAVSKLPAVFSDIPNKDEWKDVRDKVPGKPATDIPRVFVSNRPAELVITEGPPQFTPIDQTSLLYATNSENDLFLDSKTGTYFLLTAGRWFSTDKWDAPWKAASETLPEDFGKIPEDHVRARVLPAVPGTSEAEAAAIVASIPKKATINRKDVTVKVVYDGDPNFIVVKDAKTVYYAANTPMDVFRIDGVYYCCHKGVWFIAVEPAGPWAVAEVVPNALYSIPANHPKHNVTYVYIYDSTPKAVVVGYTAGYSGTYVATTGVVMFGLGYWLAYDSHHHHHHWYHYHYPSHYHSYGYAARYDYYHGGYSRGVNYYGPHGSAHGWAQYNPSTGTYSRGFNASGPGGSARGRQAYNPYTGNRGAAIGGSNPYGSWGRGAVSDGHNWARAGYRSDGQKTVGGFETSRGAKGVAGRNNQTGKSGFVGKNKYGDVYVGKNGNVYRRGDNNQWQKNSGSGWNKVDTSAARSTAKGKMDSSQEKFSNREGRNDARQRRDATSSNRSTASQRRSSTDRQSGSSNWSSRRSSSSGSRGWSSGNSGVSRQLNRDSASRSRGNRRSKISSGRSSGRSGGGRSRGGRSGGGGRRR